MVGLDKSLPNLGLGRSENQSCMSSGQKYSDILSPYTAVSMSTMPKTNVYYVYYQTEFVSKRLIYSRLCSFN